MGADDASAEAERCRVRGGGWEGIRRRVAGGDCCEKEGGAGEGGDCTHRARADRAAAAVAVRQRAHGEGHGPRHVRCREQAVLHVAARSRAAQHPGGEAHRGAAAAPEAEAGEAAAPAAPAAGVVGAARQAARRHNRRPGPRPLHRVHQRPLSRRRAGGPAVAARNRVLLRGHRGRDRSHVRHVLRQGRRGVQRAGRARAHDPAGDGVPRGSHAVVDHRHELADAGAEPPGKPDAGKAEA